MRAFPRLQMVLVLTCDEIHPHNRVTIDRQGRPVVHYRFMPEVVRALTQGAMTSARICLAAGARRVHVPMAQPPTLEAQDAERLDQITQECQFKTGKVAVSAAHLQGGCAMGRLPRPIPSPTLLAGCMESHGFVSPTPASFLSRLKSIRTLPSWRWLTVWRRRSERRSPGYENDWR